MTGLEGHVNVLQLPLPRNPPEIEDYDRPANRLVGLGGPRREPEKPNPRLLSEILQCRYEAIRYITETLRGMYKG